MSTGVGSLVVSLALEAAEYISGLTRAEQKQAELEATTARTSKAIDKQVKSLEDAAAATGKTARQVELMRLANEGATKAQLASADAALRQVEAYNLGVKIGDALKVTLLALGAAALAGVVGFRELIKGAGDFQDLSDATGASAESLASLAVSSSVAGVSIDSVGGAINKLAKNLTGVDDDSKAAGAALAAINIPIQEFKRLDPVQQYLAVGKALDNFADGSAKVAVAQALFGKGGAEQLKVLKEISSEGGAAAILTAEQIKLADDYNDAQTKQLATLKLYAQAAATQALPAITGLTGAVKDLIIQLISVDNAGSQLGGQNAVRTFAESAAIAVAVLGESLVGLARLIRAVGGSFEAVYADIKAIITVQNEAGSVGVGLLFEKNRKAIADALEARNKTVAEANQRYADLWNHNGTAVSDSLRKQFSDQTQIRKQSVTALSNTMNLGNVPDPLKPGINFAGAVKPITGGSDDTKKILDNQLKDIERGIKQQTDALASLGKISDQQFSQNLVSIADYYAKKQNLQDTALLAEVAGYDREIAAVDAARAKVTKATDIAELEGKRADLIDKRGLAEQKAGEAARLSSVQQAKSQDDLAKALSNANAGVLELQGNLSAAAAIRFDNANESLSKLFGSNKETQGTEALARLRAYAIARAQYDQETVDATAVQNHLRDAEERVAIAQQLGAVGGLEALQQLGAARQDAVHQLEAIVTAQEAVARASGSPVLVEQAQQARVALEALAASANPVADKLGGVFRDSFSGAFTDFITGSKTAGEAFSAFAQSVIRNLADIASQEIARTLFKGFGTGFADLLSFFSPASAAVPTSIGSAGSALGPYGPPLAVGTNYVPGDMFARLHKGEAVVPRAYNPAAAGGLASSGGSTYNDNSVTNIGAGVQRSEVEAGLRRVSLETESRIMRRLAQQGR